MLLPVLVDPQQGASQERQAETAHAVDDVRFEPWTDLRAFDVDDLDHVALVGAEVVPPVA